MKGHWSCVILGSLAGLLAAGRAEAIPCDAVELPNKVFGTGGSEITAMLRRVAIAMANDPEGVPEEQTTIFYADRNACDAYADFVAGTSTLFFKYWVAGASAGETDKTCEAREGGQPLDFGHSQKSLEACGEVVLPAEVRTYPATVRAVSIVTGRDSVESSISAEALRVIYDIDRQGEVRPWTDGTAILAPTGYLRDLLGRAIGLPPASFRDDHPIGDATRLTRLMIYSQDSARASQGITFVDTPTADVNRVNVKALAYQHFGQRCGVWPDSTASSFDKVNVRMGKYALWNQGRFFTRVDGQGAPVSERVANLLGWFDGSALAQGSTVFPLAQVIRSGHVPDCAMHARQDGELGPQACYAPPKPCNGFFEQTANGDTDHDACFADDDCGDALPRCNFGYCEAYRDAGQTEG